MTKCLHDTLRPRQGAIQIGRFDDVEASDVLLRLCERTVSHDHVLVGWADDSRRVRVRKRTAEDEHAIGIHLRFEIEYALHELLHLLGRLWRSLDLTADGIG